MSGEIRVDAREVTRALDRVADSVANMPEGWDAVASGLVPGVAQRTPVRTGTLAGSWEGEGEGDRAVISSPETYSGIVESWAHMVADTLAASERDIVGPLEDAIGKAAARAGFEVKG